MCFKYIFKTIFKKMEFENIVKFEFAKITKFIDAK